MSDAQAASPTFEEAITQLEGVVRALEDGTTGLDDALAAYERGVALLKSCYQHLRQAEQRIQLLTGSDDEGRVNLELFDHTAAIEAQPKNSQRRKRPPDRSASDE